MRQGETETTIGGEGRRAAGGGRESGGRERGARSFEEGRDGEGIGGRKKVGWGRLERGC